MAMSGGSGDNLLKNLSGPGPKLALTLAGVGLALLISIPVLLWTDRMIKKTFGSSSSYSKATTAPPRSAPGPSDSDVPPGAEIVASAFLADVSNGQLNLAYQRTTNNFKNRYSYPEFQALVEKLAPGFLQGSIRRLNPITTRSYRISYDGLVEGPRGSASFVLDVVYDSTEWRIEGLELSRS
jgi:hypothetical protein